MEKYYIVDLNVSRSLPPVSGVEAAGREDLEDIADLMLSDLEFETVYDSEILKAQLLSRFEDGFSRYFIIRHNKKVVFPKRSDGASRLSETGIRGKDYELYP